MDDMKELKKIDVCLPIYQTESIVSYQAIRKPTAFESLMLVMVEQHKSTLGNYALPIFCKGLKIEPVLLEKALDSLVDNDMVERINKPFTDTILQEVNLTNLGKELHRKQSMPSKARNAVIVLYFNPLLQTLVAKEKNWRTDTEVQGILLSEQLLSVNLTHIEQLGREFIDQADSQILSWKNENTNISAINTRVEGRLWQPAQIQLSLDHNGHLHSKGMTSKSVEQAALNQLLRQSEAETLWQEVLSQAFEQPKNVLKVLQSAHEHITLPKIDWQHVLDVAMPDSTIKQANVKIAVFCEKSPIMVNAGLEIVMSKDIQQPTLQGKTLKTPILFHPHAAFKGLYLDDKANSAIVFKGETEIYFAGQSRHVDLQLLIKDQGIWQQVKNRLLDNTDGSLNTDVLAFATSFLNQQQVIEYLPMMDIKPALLFKELVKKTCNVDFKTNEWMKKINQLCSLEDIAIFRKIFPQHMLSKTQLNQSLVLELFNMSLDNAFFNTEFDHSLKPLAQANQVLKSRIEDQALKRALTAQNVEHKNPQTNEIDVSQVNTKAIQAAHTWLQVFADVAVEHAAQVNQSSKLQSRLAHVKAWQALVDQKFSPKRADNKQVVVFDTSYLMQHADALDNILEHQFVVIPQVVIRELDGLKRGNSDEQTDSVKQARHAIKAIEDLTPENFEPSHVDLLAAIAKHKQQSNDTLGHEQASADEQILSVAIYHRLNGAVLYSKDKNLNNLAKSANVQIKG